MAARIVHIRDLSPGPLCRPLRRWVDRPETSDNLKLASTELLSLVSSRTTVPCPTERQLGPQARPNKRAITSLLFYGYPPELIALWCNVSFATARLYKSGARKPSKQAVRLFLLHRDGKVLGSEWRDWAVHKGKLVNPEGQEYTQGQLRAYLLVMQLARELAKDDPKAVERFYEILRSA